MNERDIPMEESQEQLLQELRASASTRALFRRYGFWYPTLAMSTVVVAAVATLLTGTIINVAIPQIMDVFAISQDKAQWLATGNLAGSTIGMLLAPPLVRMWGLRRVLAASLVVFTLGCLGGGVVRNTELLIFMRVLQGVPSGVIAPLGMLVVYQVVPSVRRGYAIGLMSIGILLAPALGPVAGGVLIYALDWRYVFLLGVPFSLLALPMALLFMPERDEREKPGGLDWWGLVLVSVCVVALLVGLSEGRRQGWSSLPVLCALGLAVLSGGVFCRQQWYSPAPLLELRLFAHRHFTILCLISFFFGAGLYGSTYIIPLFLQLVQELPAMASGAVLLPAGLAMAITFPVSGRLSDTLDHRLLMGGGILLVCLSCWLLSTVDMGTGFWIFATWMVIGRIGIGLVIPATGLGVLRSLPYTLIGPGAGASNFLRQLGGTFGVNLLAMLLEGRTALHAAALGTASGREGAGVREEWLQRLLEQLAHTGLSAGEQLSALLTQLHQKQALVLAFQDIFWVVAVAFLVLLVPTVLLERRYCLPS